MRSLLTAPGLALALAGCIGDEETKIMAETFDAARKRPDQLPVMLNERAPFEYPRALLRQKVQGNVILRLYVDSTGRMHPESTVIVESSGRAELDSAALRGAPKLRFSPARRGEMPVATGFLFPVFFRAPGAPPLPGDTILRRPGTSPPPARPSP